MKREAIEDDIINEIKQKIASKDNSVSEVYSLCDSILLYSDRVVILRNCKNKFWRISMWNNPKKITVKVLCRVYVYWPAIDISDMIDACRRRALAAKAPVTTFKSWPKTDQPWTRIHIDFAGPLEDHYYLTVIDRYSKWPEVLRCKRGTIAVTIGFLHEVFARFGLPDFGVSDNGTQFTLAEFKDFCNTFQVKHVTTPQ